MDEEMLLICETRIDIEDLNIELIPITTVTGHIITVAGHGRISVQKISVRFRI